MCLIFEIYLLAYAIMQTILHAHLLYTVHGFVKQLEKFSF